MSSAAAKLPPGVLLIERDWLSSNNIMMFDGDRAIVVDTGYNTHSQMTCALIEAALQQNPVGKPAKLAKILNTHLHSDHCGGNAILANTHECPIFVPAVCVANVNDWSTEAAKHNGLGQHCDRFHADGGIDPGQQFEAGGVVWTAHAAPGHDPDSLVFFNESHRVLISADALWEHGFGVIFPEIFGQSGFSEQVAVLDLIDSLEPALVLPGHGRAFDDVAGALSRARGRVARYIENPVSSHQNALKVLVKFVLLEQQFITKTDLYARTEKAPIFTALAAHVQMQSREAINWAIDWLEQRQQLTVDGDLLTNHEPG